ncbi:hypothetical protein O1M54_50205 [Streptomyces diastatochromogenes]|nr:hypothetical protein [Streptomyces diastatochromogenes]
MSAAHSAIAARGLLPGQDRARGQGEDEGERVASALVPAEIGHLSQAGQQAGEVIGDGRRGVGELAQRARDERG